MIYFLYKIRLLCIQILSNNLEDEYIFIKGIFMNNFDQDNFESVNPDSQDETAFDDCESPNTKYHNDWRRKPNTPVNVFAMFARSLGIFSIFCAFFSVFFGAFICGGMAIILAILSKGYHTKMERNAKFGLVAGIIGVVFQISTLAIGVYNIINVPEFREQFNSLYEQMYGAPVDDSINDFLDQLQFSDMEGGIL